MKKLIIYSLLILVTLSCNDQPNNQITGEIADHAMVVSARREASKIGSDILQQGGNAFDAMIATELALAVAYPFAGNLGGGGFMVYRKNNGEIGSLDYREKAPLAATENMYLDDDNNVIPNKSRLGALAIGVPGTIAGIFQVHEKFGTLPLVDIINPVIALAKKGVIVTQKQAQRLNYYQDLFKEVNSDSIVLMNTWKENDTIKYEALAHTLERVLKNGKDEFYSGETAKKLARFIQNNGGIITEEDLENYEAKWRTPITFKYDNLNIISIAPPSSGGICLAQIMKMIEPFNLSEYGHNSLKTIQVITEAERRSYADRSYYLGDPDFVTIPQDQLITKDYNNLRMSDFSFEKATASSDVSYGNLTFHESDETTHYSIIDQFGNAISATTTLNGAFGSKLYCSELGFFLNNEMDDFSSKPGVPNMFGLIGSKANSIQPGKRMLSSMTPTIVLKDDKLFMSVGTPGGSTIITSVLQTILNVHEFGMSMQEAVDAPRFHHQWLPDIIRMEPNSFNQELILALKNKGYIINEKESRIIGIVDGIMVLDDKRLEGGADHRGDDTAVGF
jgi:gamma-glutamyltranspeptidase/glutathione hydrolase